MSLRNSLFLKSTTVAVFGLAVLSVSGESKRATYSTEASVPASISPAIPQGQADETDVKGLVIAIHPTGFVPEEIEVTKGRYLFIVQNRSGIRDLTFQLDREAGGRVHENHDQNLQWKKEFDLHPGTYVLSVVDHPHWRCAIKVKAP
jgi:hypothetical protein